MNALLMIFKTLTMELIHYEPKPKPKLTLEEFSNSLEARVFNMSLREYHHSLGQNLQHIRTGDVVLVHNEGPRVKWRLAVINKLLTGGDDLISATEIRASNGTTNRLIAKLFPQEISSKTDSVQCA